MATTIKMMWFARIFQVDGAMVAERTVIAPAIAPSGSLRLGCRPRDRLSGAERGEVELYLFRMWADLGDHGLCEDGTVIGWDTRYWRFSSLNARQTDPNLLCGERHEHAWARLHLEHGLIQREDTPISSLIKQERFYLIINCIYHTMQASLFCLFILECKRL